MSKHILTVPMLFCIALACNKNVKTPAADEVLKLYSTRDNMPVTNDSVLADSYNYAVIVGKVDSSVVDTTTTIIFTADNGSFSTGGASYTSKIDLHGEAYAFLKSKYPGPAHVQAQAGGNYTQNLTIQFIPSWPDQLFVNLPAKTSDSLGNRLSFSTNLVKNPGMASVGFILGFYATDTVGNRKGSFTNIMPSDSSGTVNAQFWLQDSTYKGFLTVTAYLVRNTSDSIKGTNKMLITNK